MYVVRGTPCSLEIDEPSTTALIAPVMDSSDHRILLPALLAFPGLDPFWLSFSVCHSPKLSFPVCQMVMAFIVFDRMIWVLYHVMMKHFNKVINLLNYFVG